METETRTLLKINEIYLSLQGESTWAGLPCVFVRLTGCSLRCTWCDTAYAFFEGEDQGLEKILARVDSFGVKRVEITGGEPLEQEGVYPLMEALLTMGYEVLLETSGAVDVGRVPGEVVKIMDIKCPGSGEDSRNHWANLEKLVPRQDEIKFVLKDKADYDYAKKIIERHGLAEKFTLLFSPSHDELEASQLSEWMLQDKVPARLNLQLHKYIWPNDTKGR
ncbi:MAG TPA: radical SAM protein [bacterium]|jgi:7-carboxy-7-deazaguanine synthase|nr:radical SAM protein [bacterium]